MSKPLDLSAGTLRPLLGVALPVLAEQLLNVLVGFVDTYLAGNILPGASYLAAIGLMAYTLWLISTMFASVAIGTTAMVSRFMGAGDVSSACRVTNQSFLLGVGFAIVATLLVSLLGEWYVDVLRLETEAAQHALRYLQIITPAVPAIMIMQVGIASLRGAGDTVTGLRVMIVVNVVNVGVSYGLAVGAGFLPTLGWEGLAIGTLCAELLGAVMILAVLVRGRAGLQLRASLMKPDPELMHRVLRIGLPGGADMAAVLFCHLWFLSIINGLGTPAAAAHGLAVRIEALAYLPGLAFQVAAATLCGQYLGAKNPRGAVWSGVLSCLVGGGLMVVAGLMLLIFADPLAEAFVGSDKPETARMAATLLRIVSLAIPSLAVSIILTGTLRGAGDTRWPLVFSFLGFLLIRIPGAYYLALDEIHVPFFGTFAGLGMGVVGAWWAMVADVIFRSLLIVGRFLQGGWQKVDV
jgi:putative MATE family efflux protein